MTTPLRTAPELPLEPGLHVLIGRPATGKTRWACQALATARAAGRITRFRSLEHARDALPSAGADLGPVDDTAGAEGAGILAELAAMRVGSVYVLDYLQLVAYLGERSELPARLHGAAVAAGVSCLVLSQLDRTFEEPGREREVPGWCGVAVSTLRLPHSSFMDENTSPAEGDGAR